jgi:hypothetical protein
VATNGSRNSTSSCEYPPGLFAIASIPTMFLHP